MSHSHVHLLAGLLIVALAGSTPADAQTTLVGPGLPNEPSAGQPPAGSTPSVKDFDYQIKYHRAFEAMLWSMPATSIYSFRRSAFQDLRMADNDIIANSAGATPSLEALTANSTTPYIAAFSDLRKGPVVLEVPAAGPDASLYGQVVDAWQFTIADVGPAGLDKGKGAKYLFTPPGYKDAIPDGYIHVASPNYRIALAFRAIAAPSKTAADAHGYAQKLRMYYLSQAADPPKQRFVDTIGKRFATLPRYDEGAFQDIYDIVSVEPVKETDKVMMGMLTSLGIERGKPYAPDDTTKRAMRAAAADAWFYLQGQFDATFAGKGYWPDRHYTGVALPDANRTFTYVYNDRIDLIPRALLYFFATFLPEKDADRPANQYLAAIADKNGHPLEGGKLYSLTVPKDMPVKQFWALTVYDRATFAFIYTDSERTTLSSLDLAKMKANADGSVTLYVGPKAPAGLETNWIPTRGKRPMPMLRFYGATDAIYDKTFKMPDFEEVQ